MRGPVVVWTHERVRYALHSAGMLAGLLTAVGPGLRIRAARLQLTDAAVAEWLTAVNAARAALAETALAAK